MELKVDTFTTKNNKRIYFYQFGNLNSIPIFFFHGYPGTGKQALLLRDTHFQDDFCIIAIDRPGYGLSEPQPGLTLKKFATDINDLANYLQIEKFISMGVSGGGPFASAVAFYYPEKVSKVGSVCGVAPVTHENIFYLNREQKKIYLLKKILPNIVVKFLVERKFSSFLEELDHLMASDLLSSKDKEIFKIPEVGAFLLESFKEALAKGPAGILADMEILSNPWGFALEEIKVPYFLWHGDNDDIVHFEMSNYMKKRLKNVKLKICAGEGHYSLPYNYKDKILSDLLDK